MIVGTTGSCFILMVFFFRKLFDYIDLGGGQNNCKIVAGTLQRSFFARLVFK